jgi:hypothetical protein
VTSAGYWDYYRIVNSISTVDDDAVPVSLPVTTTLAGVFFLAQVGLLVV